jgi:hypothetical protein
VPGIIGTSDVQESSTNFLDGTNSPIGNPVGVMGISATSFGLVGMNVSANISTNAQVPDAIQGLFNPLISAGVFGWRMDGRGGVFASATPVVESVGPPFPPTNQGTAQVRLVPVPVSSAGKVADSAPPSQPNPSLPQMGLAGDLIAVDVAPTEGGSATQLWFCIKSALDGGSATWAKIAFGASIVGQY